MNSLMMTEKTMSSVEIAELCEKEHRNVMRDIRQMLVVLHGEDRVLSFEQTVERQNPSGGAPIKSACYCLPKRETLILVSGYRIDIRAKIIDRWQELEASQAIALPNFTDPAAAAIAWAAEYQAKQMAQSQVMQLESKVDELTPKAKALDSIANATGLKTVSQAAKPLGVQPEKVLRPYMKTHKWIFWGSDNQYHAYAERIRAGHLKEKDRIITHKDGSQEVKVTVYVTPLGESLLAQRLDEIIEFSKAESAA